MEYIIHILLGIFATFVGFLAPGMLNMTAVQIAIEKSVQKSRVFALGASVIILIQASIALYFSTFLSQNPSVIESLEVGGIFVFFALAIFFFMKTRAKLNIKEKKDKEKSYFVRGVLMAVMNMLAIPFYLGISTFLGAEGLLKMEIAYIITFVFGALFGAYLLFFTYISFAKVIIKRANFIAKNINYILSLLFLVLGIWTWIK
ncbi:MAG: LysE family transporter [Flavobacteriaceae bacterium]